MLKLDYRNIVFDLGNVLVDIDYDRTFQELSALLSSAELSEIQRIGGLYEVGKLSTPLFINAMLRFGHSQVQALDVIKAWNSMLLSIPYNSISLIDSVSKVSNVYILSNTNKLHIEWVNRYLMDNYDIESFDQLVKKAFYSHELGERKPDHACFYKVIDQAGINPRESLFIDDNLENVNAAKACGFDAINITNTTDVYRYFELLSEEE